MTAAEVEAIKGISIHAAREGGDVAVAEKTIGTLKISIHAAREGGDAFPNTTTYKHALFQSTPPVKAATASQGKSDLEDGISIHAAREGGDGGNE